MASDPGFAELVKRLAEAAEDSGKAALIRRFADDDVLEAMLDAIFADLRREGIPDDPTMVEDWGYGALIDTSTVYLHGWCKMAWDYDGIEWFDDKGHFSWWGIGWGMDGE